MKLSVKSKIEPTIQPVENTPKSCIRMYNVGITSSSIENQFLNTKNIITEQLKEILKFTKD